MKHLLRSAFLTAVLSTGATFAAEPIKVTERIDIFDLMRKGEVEYNINPNSDPADKAEDVFLLKDNELTITGRGWGHMITKSAFRDYRLVVEFKWTGRTWGTRKDKARDCGILVHCHGPLDALGGTWPASIEAQIIEGGMGDFLVLSPKLPDGTVLQTSLESEFELDRDKERRWKKGAVRQQVLSGRINWELRDEDWKDVVDFRAKNDPDAPIGEWNKMEVIAKGDTVQVLFNGRMVNEGFAAKPSSGPVAIQTEAAELVVRRYELLPLEGDGK